MRSKLLLNGYINFFVHINDLWLSLIKNNNYNELDYEATKALKAGGFLYELMAEKLPFYFSKDKSFEHIISLRAGPQDEELDGIWHDDGSRDLAFSLSLNKDYKSILGGELLLRKKSSIDNVISIHPRPIGTLSVFCTGKDGWEHKTNFVKLGSRLVLAGWLS